MRRNVVLVGVCLLTATAVGLLAMSRTDHEVSLESVVEIWADVIRDVDRLGLTMTRVSAEREMEIGQEIEKHRPWRLKDDPVLQAYVAAVGQSLVPHVQRKGISYRFAIIDSPMINAFALPGGGIVITTGMLNFLESEAELAAILGHEISHVDLRHCIERLQYELAARKIVGRELAMIVRIQYQLVNLGFNEQHELEADAGGVILAAMAGYDPRAAKTVFERLATVQRERERKEQREKPTLMVEEVGTALKKALEHYFATHPPSSKRAQQLERLFARNAPTWRLQKFYIGRSNYRDRIPRSSEERPEELVSSS
ncbi:MAG: M48 family metalloprotease [Candidatus Methylomirabilales bacterium]